MKQLHSLSKLRSSGQFSRFVLRLRGLSLRLWRPLGRFQLWCSDEKAQYSEPFPVRGATQAFLMASRFFCWSRSADAPVQAVCTVSSGTLHRDSESQLGGFITERIEPRNSCRSSWTSPFFSKYPGIGMLAVAGGCNSRPKFQRELAPQTITQLDLRPVLMVLGAAAAPFAQEACGPLQQAKLQALEVQPPYPASFLGLLLEEPSFGCRTSANVMHRFTEKTRDAIQALCRL